MYRVRNYNNDNTGLKFILTIILTALSMALLHFQAIIALKLIPAITTLIWWEGLLSPFTIPYILLTYGAFGYFIMTVLMLIAIYAKLSE